MNGNGRLAVVVMCTVMAACGGDGTDWVGQPPAESAAQLAERGCETIFRCGAITVSCEPPGAAYQPASDFFANEAACIAEQATYYTNLLTGCAALGLTEAQSADVNECFDDYGASSCLSERELMELAVAICAGDPFGSPTCVRATETLQACQQCHEEPDDPSCDES